MSLSVQAQVSISPLAITLLRISHKHFQVKNILAELIPLKQNHPKESIDIMAINHLNTLAQYHTIYVFKVILSGVTRVVCHEVEHKKALYINSLAHLSLSI